MVVRNSLDLVHVFANFQSTHFVNILCKKIVHPRKAETPFSSRAGQRKRRSNFKDFLFGPRVTDHK